VTSYSWLPTVDGDDEAEEMRAQLAAYWPERSLY
jgi:hypothetical protein